MHRLTGKFYEIIYGAGWSSSVARWAHNPKVAGSNPAPATISARQGVLPWRVFILMLQFV